MNIPLTETILSLPFRPLGGRPSFDPDGLDRFLSATRVATMSYVRNSGRSNQTPLWYDYSKGEMRFVASSGSAKHRALQKDPRVCVVVQDDQPPYRAAIIDGTVDLTDLGTAGKLSHQMAIKYFGEAGAFEYDKMTRAHREMAGETLLRLVPTEVNRGCLGSHLTFTNTRAKGAALYASTGITILDGETVMFCSGSQLTCWLRLVCSSLGTRFR